MAAMKRILLMTAAVATLATALPLGGIALAREGDGHGRGPPPRADNGGRGNGGGRGAERGPPPRYEGGRREPDRRSDGGRREGERRYDDRRGDDRRADDRRYDDRRGEERRYDDGRRPYRSLREDGPYPPPADARPARRGGYLPDSYRGGVVDDYQRFRLRPPPRGYAWVRVNGGFALVSVVDGRIFDVIPD
jgi:Ni/Co efflux regulator RcnB